LSERLDWRPGRWTLVALIAVAAALSRPSDTLAGGGASEPATADVTNTVLGHELRAQASERLRALGPGGDERRWRVFRDRNGYVVVPRNVEMARNNGNVVPVLRPVGVRSAATREVAATTPSWSFAGGGCFERISDGWSWLDHCARIYRLTQDGDSLRDYYALQRYGTAGSNMPWVLKEAELASEPVETSPPMSWLDWNPRSDHAGPCSTITVRVTTPLAGVSQQVDRCETWDITKGATGGDFGLAWSGCACIQDRELSYVLSISVPQGTLPAWYVPAEVHGFAF
jgi:hypothetical protein